MQDIIILYIVYLHDFYNNPRNVYMYSIQVEAGGQTHEFDHVVSSIPSSGTLYMCVYDTKNMLLAHHKRIIHV